MVKRRLPSLSRGRLLTFVGLAIIIYLGVIVFQTVKHNYELGTQINALQSQITDLSTQQAQLQYDVQYYKTNAFQEKSARSNLGLMQPGEGVIVLPKTPASTLAQAPPTKKPAHPQSNLAQWWHFLFG